MKPRDQVVRLRCTEDEAAQVRDLAEADGVSVSHFIRAAIRRMHAARFPEAKKVAHKPRASRS